MDVAHAAAAVEQHTHDIGHDVDLSNTTLGVAEEKFRRTTVDTTKRAGQPNESVSGWPTSRLRWETK